MSPRAAGATGHERGRRHPGSAPHHCRRAAARSPRGDRPVSAATLGASALRSSALRSSVPGLSALGPSNPSQAAQGPSSNPFAIPVQLPSCTPIGTNVLRSGLDGGEPYHFFGVMSILLGQINVHVMNYLVEGLRPCCRWTGYSPGTPASNFQWRRATAPIATATASKPATTIHSRLPLWRSGSQPVKASIQSCQKIVRIPRIPAHNVIVISSHTRTFEDPTQSPSYPRPCMM